MELIIEIGLIFVSAAILAYISKIFKQPIIPAYILAGLILTLTGAISPNGFVDTISHLGIAFLLFIVGLEIDFDRIKDVGKVSTIGGTIVAVICFVLGFLASGLMGFTPMEAIYIGLVIAFSSTMIVVKLLADRNELDTLHGRIVLGILLVQDFFAILAMFILSTIDNFSFTNLFMLLIIFTAVGAVIYMFSKIIFPSIFKYAAKTEELLFVTAVAVCLTFIGIFHYLNFSIAIGAFLAGLTLGNLPYNIEIISLVKPLRDFFAVIFFVSLGMQLEPQNIQWYPILVIIILLVLVKPFLFMVVNSVFGYKKRPSFMISISLAQASEFALILLMFGVGAGHIGQTLFSSIILVTIITMALTAYLFEYEKKLYKISSKFLGMFEKLSDGKEFEYIPKEIAKDVIFCGYDRLGYNILDTLEKMKYSFIVVDYNPEVVKNLMNKKIPCIYGDIGDSEILHRLDLKDAKMIISTVPDTQDNHMLIKKTKEVNPKAIVIVTSMHVQDALSLYKLGADYVILPHFLGGERVGLFLEEAKGDLRKILEKKLSHIKELKKRHKLGHKHPKRKK